MWTEKVGEATRKLGYDLLACLKLNAAQRCPVVASGTAEVSRLAQLTLSKERF